MDDLSKIEVSQADGSRRRSRAAFAAAVLTFVTGTFVSFGGAGYAASSGSHAIRSITHTAKAKTSATSQYGSPTVAATPPAKPGNVAGAVRKSPTVAATTKPSGTLPFTGLSLVATSIIGLALIALGVALRRFEKRATPRA